MSSSSQSSSMGMGVSDEPKPMSISGGSSNDATAMSISGGLSNDTTAMSISGPRVDSSETIETGGASSDSIISAPRVDSSETIETGEASSDSIFSAPRGDPSSSETIETGGTSSDSKPSSIGAVSMQQTSSGTIIGGLKELSSVDSIASSSDSKPSSIGAVSLSLSGGDSFDLVSQMTPGPSEKSITQHTPITSAGGDSFDLVSQMTPGPSERSITQHTPITSAAATPDSSTAGCSSTGSTQESRYEVLVTPTVGVYPWIGYTVDTKCNTKILTKLEAVMLVMGTDGSMSVLLLDHPSGLTLPGVLFPQTSETNMILGLQRGLSRLLLSPDGGEVNFPWQVTDCIAILWQRGDGFVPLRVPDSKMCRKIYLVKLPCKLQFYISTHTRLTPVSLGCIMENPERYEDVIAQLPLLLSKFSLV